MKKLNQKNNMSNTKLLERGGLMIEALAMLGLIAVVTPTMYKKSAERTLEVEDINTATTVRTYMNAVEAYMANEYGSFVSERQAGDPAVTAHTGKKGHFYEDPNNPEAFGSRDGPANAYYVDNAELANYLPYGFDVNRAMYDYNAPETRIVKNGNNLTAFVRFRAKNGQADGIGQERTARIASLVGSTGGYMPNSNTARGIGGIWSLNSGNLDNLFGNDAAGAGAANTYSLVTASANVAMDVNGGQMDNDKYLQRTREDDTDPGSGDEIWRNTMRTDLYLGGHVGNETQTVNADEDSKRHSIRNIQSLIVGADQAEMIAGGNDDEGNPLPDTESTKYGLYITGSANADYANAYIGGTLSALKRGFYVTTGEQIDNAADDDYAGTQFLIGENDSADYTTEIRGNGDITNAGANGILLGNFANEDGSVITIGDTPKNDGSAGIGLTLENDGEGMYSYYLGENFEIEDDTAHDANDADSQDSVNIIPNGFRQIPAANEAGWADAPTLSNAYKNANKFQVNVGTNTIVDGLLAAGQIDTQKIRAANLSVGSQNVEDADKWLDVDQYGVMIETPSQSRGTMGHSILALANPFDGGSDGVYLQIRNATGLGYASNRYTDFWVDSDGFNYDQRQVNQKGYFNINVEDSSSDSTLQAGSISLTAKNGYASDGKKTKGTITLDAKNGEDTDGNALTGVITLKNSKMKMVMGNNNDGHELLISNAAENSTTHDSDSKDYRVHMLGGWLDLENAGFHVSKDSNPVFSVNVMDKKWEGFAEDFVGDNWTDDDGSAMSNNTVYATATHGPAIFTNYLSSSDNWIDTAEYLSYLSVGAHLKEASVSITGGGEPGVMLIDTDLEKNDIDPTYDNYSSVDDEYELTGWGTGETIKPGTVYVRKGRVELIPEVGASPHSARTGSGTIAAERFVANNPDDEGNRIEVPHMYREYTASGQLILTPTQVERYEDKQAKDIKRYDTYMVNPAYTSVMHDIKLTTRGGARLSDILPDFINKGIYIASNTIKEGANDRKMEFKLTAFGVDGFTDDDGVAASAYDPVSPYMGVVPAPQCPPGYGRVITLNPVSFEMSIAGTPRLEKLDHDDKYTYYAALEDTMPDAMKNEDTAKLLTTVDESDIPAEGHVMYENNKLMPRRLDIRTPVLGAGETAKKSGGFEPADGVNDRAWSNDLDIHHKSDSGNKKIKLEDDSFAENFTITNFQNIATNLRVTTTNTKVDSTGAKEFDQPYVLGYNTDDIHNIFRPLTFQQSTFLKSAAVPLVMGKTKKFGDTADIGEYTSGWAVLMGFIYPYDNYKTVIEQLKPNISEFSSFATGFYWNIFPVLRDRLEAYATVYCYFDRNNLYGANVETGDGVKHIDPYDYIDSLPISFKKQSHGDYLERLNDPALEYNETW